MVADLARTFVHDRWRPDPAQLPEYQVSKFMASAGLDSYTELVAKAAAEPCWFYPAAFDFLGLEWMCDWTRLIDDAVAPPFTRWFPDGGTNVSWLAGKRLGPDACAIQWEGDGGESRSISSAELDTLVSQLAAGLRSLEVCSGDVVTMYLPMIPEAVVTMLAVARIGAIVSPAFSGYGAEALAERIELGGAKVLIAADGFMRRGKPVPMIQTALDAARITSCPPQVVVVPRLSRDVAIPGTVSWADLLSRGVDGPAQIFDSAHPWLLAFTSGSSGRPKGVVHTHGGLPYGAAIDFAFALDVRHGDRLCWPSDMGWLVGPLTSVVTLALGATLVLFEGVMDHPQSDRLWQLVDRYRLTHLGFSPTTARILALAGESWVERHSLDSLRIIPSTGEPWTKDAWRWLHRNVGRGRAAIINWSGGTEVGGGILAGSPAVETLEGRFAGPVPGMDVDVVDDAGASVTEEVGELVLKRGWPSMTDGLWNERERYLDTYWSQLPGRWVHGDQAIRHLDGSWEVPGRSDDVIKVAGKRLGPSELEALALGVPGVALAGAVGVPHRRKGQVPVVAITLSNDVVEPADVASEVSAAVEDAMGKPMRPEAVVVVKELPFTRSNKVHRRALRCWLADIDAGDLTALVNPDCEDAIRQAGHDNRLC